MKNVDIPVVLLCVIILTALGFVQYGTTGADSSISTSVSQPVGAGSRSERPSFDVGTAAMTVSGTVTAIDPKNNRLMVTENISGTERTFTVADKSILDTLQKGDQVQVMPKPADPTIAERIEK